MEVRQRSGGAASGAKKGHTLRTEAEKDYLLAALRASVPAAAALQQGLVAAPGASAKYPRGAERRDR